MSFLFRKQSKEGKKKTEQQLYAGKDGPGSCFDLSECDLHEIPPGLFAQCKYLRKQILILHSNHLRTLKSASDFSGMDALTILDISNNELRALPDDIGRLKSLQELNVSRNKLKQLPQSIGGLSNLAKLQAQSNCLEGVPGALGQCKNLVSMDVLDNYDIVGLPPDLAHAQSLQVINVRHDRFGFPPKSIMAEGVPAIMKFLCNSCNIPYNPTSEAIDSAASPAKSGLYPSLSQEVDGQSDALKKVSAERDRQQAEGLAREQQALVAQEQQALMSSSNSRKLELLKQLAEDQAKQDAELAVLQQRRESDQQKLVETVQKEEKSFNEAVAQKMREAERNREADIHRALQQDRAMLEQLSSMRQETEELRRAEVLEAMQHVLSKSRHQELLCIAHINERKRLAQESIKESNAVSDMQVSAILKQQSEFQRNLLNQMASEDLAQRFAFEALLLDKDDQHRRATQQIQELQQKLAQLTVLEIEKKSKEQSEKQARLEEERNLLTQQLRVLMDVRQDRAEQLQHLLVKFEEDRKLEEKDYWLRMYQRLMDSKPEALILDELSLEESVIHILRTTKTTQFLVSFARNNVTFEMMTRMDDDDLRRLGVTSLGAREAILKCIAEEAAIESRAQEKAVILLSELKELEPHEKLMPSAPLPVAPSAPSQPSAPPCFVDDSALPAYPGPPPSGHIDGLPMTTPATVAAVGGATAVVPSAPSPQTPTAESMSLSECVVCMDNQSNCVLLNCGHVCSCYSCSMQLTTCPMCRADIANVVQLYMT